MNGKILIAIPARLSSSRLPNKPLADIVGKSMIRRVYEQAISANLGEVIIACDGLEIAEEVKNFGGKFIITDPALPSGTDRIYAAFKTINPQSQNDFEVVVNLQGDLPNIDPQIVKEAALTAMQEDCDFATVASKITNQSEITNPNVVKIAIAFEKEKLGRALYFSRAAIPYHQTNQADFFHHVGIYAYKKSALKKFVHLPPSALEKRENLEQLRALENNMKILVKIVDSTPLSVDTEEDLDAIRKMISAAR